MTPIEETLEGILQALVADPRLADRRDRCWVLRGLAATSRGFDRTDYELGSGERNCSSFPYDRFPWDDAAR